MAAFVAALRLTDIGGTRWPAQVAARRSDPHDSQMVEPERLYAVSVAGNWLHLWWVRDAAGSPLLTGQRGVFMVAGRPGALRRVWDAVPAPSRMTLAQLRQSTEPAALGIKASWGDYRHRDELDQPIGSDRVKQYATVLGADHAADAETTMAAEIAAAVPEGAQWND